MLLTMVWVGGLSASPAVGSIYHQEPSNVRALEPLTLEALVEADQAVVSVTIHHRVRGQNIYLETPMANMGDNLYFGTLPASEIQEEGLEYYIVAILADESALAYPDSDPINNPVSINVAAIADIQNIAQEAASGPAVESDVLILAPDPNMVVLADEVVVAVSLFNLAEVDVSSIQLFVDGEDVTAMSDVSADLVSYSPPSMTTGNHNIEMRVSSVSGATYTPTRWAFRATSIVSETSERSFKQTGRVTSGYRKDNIDNAILAVQDINVTYNAGWDWLKLQSRAKISSEEDQFKQARNRYSVKIEMPILNIGVGDVTPRISKFGMDGKRVRGLDFNLKLKMFNLQVVQGELERSIAGHDLDAFSDLTYDSPTDTTYVMNLSRRGYTFKRDITAIRPSFGSGEQFEWAFFYISARDNVNSVPTALPTGLIFSPNSEFNDQFLLGETPVLNDEDSLIGRIMNYQDLQALAATNAGLEIYLPDDEWDGRSPQDNLVLGSDVMLAFNKRRMVFKTGFAFSMRNSNIWDPAMPKDSLDTLAPGDNIRDGKLTYDPNSPGIEIEGLPDPVSFADYFIINQNMIPLVPIDPFLADSNIFQAVIKMPSMAYHASANLNYFNNYITVSYQQVGPEYESFANPNIQKNVRIKSISDRIRMLRNKLMFNVRYKTTDDDIVKYEGDVITSSTSLSYNAVLNLGNGLPSFTFGKRSYTRDNLTRSGDELAGFEVVTYDSLVVEAVDGTDSLAVTIRDPRSSTLTSSTNIGVTYRLWLLETTHDFNLNIATTLITDEITDRPVGLTTYHSPYANSDILSIGVTSNFSKDFRTNLSVSTNRAEFGEVSDSSLIVQELTNIGATFNYKMFSGKLLLRGGLSLMTSNTDQSISAIEPPPAFTRIGIQGGLEYTIYQNLRIISGFEFRNKRITLPDGGTESSPSSIISANLAYVF